MTLFDDREGAFEAKFAHDEDRRLIGLARGNRLFGFWAAEQLGLELDERESYAQDVMRFGLAERDEQAVLWRVVDDLRRGQRNVTDGEATRTFLAMQVKAREQMRIEELTTPEFQPQI